MLKVTFFVQLQGLLLFLSPLACAQSCQGDAVLLEENPLGTCACDGHLWVAPMCTKGYYCFDNSGSGCYKECPEGEMLSPDFGQDSWGCFDPLAPPGGGKADSVDARNVQRCPWAGYNVCTGSDEVETPPTGPITENPLGNCHCDGELWVSEGCSYGFLCDSGVENGGGYLECPEGQTILINAVDHSWGCTDDTSTCPGGPVEGVGCVPRDCVLSQNPLGQCECDGQMFINHDCTEGFLCTENVADPFLYDGCSKRCLENERLVPDYSNEDNEWICVDLEETNYLCPGQFNLECPENEIGHGLDSSMCECDGQLIVSGDCKEAFYCVSVFPGGGSHIQCPNTDEVIIYDFDLKDWDCMPETTHECPALGGFKLGCFGSEVSVPPPTCDFEENPLGTCGGCEGQIFISDDCTESFYCTEYVPADQADTVNGCLKHCEAGERVHVDYASNTWECVTQEDDFVCPGLFHVDCDDDAFNNVKCHCETELWMREDCGQAFICEAAFQDQGSNQGHFIECEPGQVIKLDFTDITNYSCSDDASTCPGSFHFGCERDDLVTQEPPQTETTTQTETPPQTPTTQNNPAPNGASDGRGKIDAFSLVMVVVVASLIRF